MLESAHSFHVKIVCTVIAVLLWTQPGFGQPERGDVQNLNFHFVIPTEGRSHILNRQGSLKLEFRNTPFSKMKETLQRCVDANLMPCFGKRSPLMYIYLPDRETYRTHKNYLAAEAQRQFGEVYPGAELNIKFRVVKTNINVRYVYDRVRDLLKNMRQRFANDTEAQTYIKVLEQANENAFQQAAGIEVTAPTARKIKFTMASSRFAIVAATRTMQTLPILSNGGAPAAVAMGLIVTDAATEFFTVAFTQNIQRWIARWPLRSKKTAFRAQLAQIVNNSVWNYVLFSVGRPTIMQAIAHTADDQVPMPTSDTVADVAGISAVGVGFYAAFTHGYNSLRDKGWVSASQIDIVLQVNGLVDLATSIINSNPNWYGYRVLTLGPQWLFYSIVGVMGKFAPNRSDKILAVESSVLDWADVHGEQTADASWHITNDRDFEDVLAHHALTVQTSDCDRLVKVE